MLALARKYWQLIVSALVVAALGALAGYLVAESRHKPEVIAPVAEKRQADGSLVLARNPEPPKPAPHKIPRKATEERRMAVTVQPKRPDCPPVRVDLSLVRELDGRRVIASSPDGKIIAGVDVPIEGGTVPAFRPWAAGLGYSISRETYSAWIERDVGRIRFGAEVGQDRHGALDARVRVGWTF